MALAGLMARSSLESPGKEVRPAPWIQENDDRILLNNNESPFGISPAAMDAITESIPRSSRYPHKKYSQLIDSIAKRENIPPDHIILGAGSTDVMVTLIHHTKKEGEILVADPTYFDFIYYANQANRKLNKVGLNADFEHDLEAMEKRVSSKTDLVYLCNPNNPTGSITPKDKMKSFCENTSGRALVVVDEAYHEYVEDTDYSSMVDLVRKGKNLIVTRTFSKIFGLAGLRVGYGMARPEIIAELDRLSRNFAPVAWLSLKAAIAGYQDRMFLRHVREKNKQVKSYLYGELKKLGLFFIPSHTNFVLFEVKQDAAELVKKMAAQKVLVRAFGFHEKQWIRASCGTLQELQHFIKALAALI